MTNGKITGWWPLEGLSFSMVGVLAYFVDGTYVWSILFMFLYIFMRCTSLVI